MKVKATIHYYWVHTLCVLGQERDQSPEAYGVSSRLHRPKAKNVNENPDE